jgi:hypothetical protein
MGFSKLDDDPLLYLELRNTLTVMTLHPTNFVLVSRRQPN